MVFDEESFKARAAVHIVRCRPGDWAHALRVVEWVKRLDPPDSVCTLLVAAAYIHDIGWRDVVPSTVQLTFKELLEHEPQANANSIGFAKEFLVEQGFSADDTTKVLEYIAAADQHRAKNDFEAYIVDADNLSKLNMNHLREKFQRSEWSNLLEHWEKELPLRMQTTKGKQLFPGLLEDLRSAIAGE